MPLPHHHRHRRGRRELPARPGTAAACLGLRGAPFRVGEAFLASPAPEVHACLILDIHLPGMSAFELVDRLRAYAPPRPAIFITAQDEHRTRERAFGIAESAYLRKPFTGAALLEAVRLLLRRNGASLDSPGA
jgi:DNA-binding response OmpR family regulator